jgi:hypothetical protein
MNDYVEMRPEPIVISENSGPQRVSEHGRSDCQGILEAALLAT